MVTIKVEDLLKKNYRYMWYQDEFSLEEQRVKSPFKFGTSDIKNRGNKAIGYPNMIEEIPRKELEK